MANITALLAANILGTEDTTGDVIINRGTGNPAFDLTLFDYTGYKNLPTAASDFSISGQGLSSILVFYVRNLHASAVVTVKWTPVGGAAVTVCALGPGAQLIYWTPPAVAATGIQTILVNPDTNNTPIEFAFGG